MAHERLGEVAVRREAEAQGDVAHRQAIAQQLERAVHAHVARDHIRGVIRIGRRVMVKRDELLAFKAQGRAVSSGGNRR